MKKRRLYILIALLFLASTSFATTTLSLDEAILLAVSENPNVQSSRLNLVLQKFNVFIQHWQFRPHYSFQTSAMVSRAGTPAHRANGSYNLNAQPSVSLLTPIGTQLSVTASNTKTGNYNPGLTLQVMQPLLRGFGRAVVESALYNAIDSELITRLSIEGMLRQTVTTVINAYLDVVMAERALKIDQEALERAEKSVEQTRLFIKAGRKAGNELVTVEANVASAKSQLENDRNTLMQTKYALLAAIGIDPNSEIHFTSLDIDRLIAKYHPIDMNEAKQLILANDIQYQTDQITLHGSTSRNLLIAQDNTRWSLGLTANVSTGNGSGGGSQNAGFNSLFNGANQSQSVQLTLQIPIDDQLAKQNVLSAKIALQQAELALKQEKWGKETSAINGWNNVLSAKRALHFAENAENLQQKTYKLNFQKYLHGLIDSLELQSAQDQLIKAQQSSLSARISYLKALVNLDLLIGNTLKTWDVQSRR